MLVTSSFTCTCTSIYYNLIKTYTLTALHNQIRLKGMGLFYNLFSYFIYLLSLENTNFFIMGFLSASLPILILFYFTFSLNSDGRKANSSTDSIFPFVSKQVSDLPTKTQEYIHVPFSHERIPEASIIQRSQTFYHFMNQRRTMRFFSKDPVPIEVVQNCILAAGTGPSGAHCQPWTFVIVKDQDVRSQLREIIEKEERVNYDHRMSHEWVQDLGPMMGILHVDNEVVKPYLEEAAYLVIVLKQQFGVDRMGGDKIAHYYPMESVCIATGIFITAIHNANLTSLVSTPMGSENAIRVLCNRPDNERVLFLIPVGFPALDATVPYRDGDSLRKPLEHIMQVV